MKKYDINPENFIKDFHKTNDWKVDFISEENYEEKMIEKVEPFLKSVCESGYFEGKEKVKIYYEKFLIDDCVGNIVISHGFGESTEKYYEFIYYLLKNNYSVFIMEHRGNCRSQRLGIDDSQVSVERFEYYIEDFKKFIDTIVCQNCNDKDIMLFAHSMGGAIGTVFLEQFPEYFKAAVLSAPMHEINTGKVPKFAADLLMKTLRLFKKEMMYVPGENPYRERYRLSATKSKVRYQYYRNKVTKNKFYQSGGASVNWYNESLNATKNLLKKKNAQKVEIPVLLLQAEYDTYVMPKAHYKFARYAKDCEVVYVRESRHESYYETDDITFAVISKILSFYKDQL